MNTEQIAKVWKMHLERNDFPFSKNIKPTFIHVNRQHIAMNYKDGKNRPVYTIKIPGQPVKYAREVEIQGPCKMIYNGNQLKCGARAWIETYSDVVLIDEMSFSEARKSV